MTSTLVILLFAGLLCHTMAQGLCDPNPCLHSGTCTVTGGDFQCACDKAYHGKTCNLVSKCGPTYSWCHYGGTCTPFLDTMYLCNCPANRHGRNCQTTSASVRLVGGRDGTEGRVEVELRNGQWGTICSTYWDTADAGVVCSMLGFNRAGAIPTIDGNIFGNGTGTIWRSFLECNGQENDIRDCGYNQLFADHVTCEHYQDAGVMCVDPNNPCKPT